jgi:hypothetical protein
VEGFQTIANTPPIKPKIDPNPIIEKIKTIIPHFFESSGCIYIIIAPIITMREHEPIQMTRTGNNEPKYRGVAE